jgi:hypothetical protein
MLDQIFLPNPPADKYLRASDERGGAASILVGIAANKCFQTNQPVEIASLVTGLSRADYAPMPKNTDPVPMPARQGGRGGGGGGGGGGRRGGRGGPATQPGA